MFLNYGRQYRFWIECYETVPKFNILYEYSFDLLPSFQNVWTLYHIYERFIRYVYVKYQPITQLEIGYHIFEVRNHTFSQISIFFCHQMGPNSFFFFLSFPKESPDFPATSLTLLLRQKLV